MSDRTIQSDVFAEATVDAAEVDRFSRLAGEWARVYNDATANQERTPEP